MVVKFDVTLPELSGDESRRAYVYVPDSYEEDEDMRYPVLYMFDGHNLFFDDEATYGKSWGLKDFMDEMDVPMIIAAVACNEGVNNERLSEYSPFSTKSKAFFKTPIEGKGDLTMQWYVNEFKPFIDSEFPTIPDREHTFIGGSSMGGLMSMYALFQYNEVFSKAVALSPSIWFETRKLKELFDTPVDKNTMLYMNYGENEISFHPNMKKQYAKVTAQMIENGILVESRIVPDGDHSEACWEKQIPFFVNSLLYEP